MKKLIGIIGLLLLAAGIGVGYFLLTFDANQYRSVLAKQIESSIGYPVKLGNVSLTWAHGIGLRLDDFSIYPGPGSQQPSVRVDEATADLEWLALLSQHVKIGSIELIGPEIRLIRSADGKVRLAGTPADAVKRPKFSASTAAFSLLINRLDIENGKLLMTDETLAPSLDIAVQRINMTIKDISLTDPIRFTAGLALWGQDENVRIKGRVQFFPLQAAAEFRNLQIQTDLGVVDYAALMRSCPNLKDAGINSDLRGQMTAEIEKLRFEKRTVPSGIGTVAWRGGSASFADGFKIADAEIRMSVNDRDLSILPSSFTLAGGKIDLQGDVRDYRSHPSSEVAVKVNGLSIGELPLNVKPGEPRLTGLFSVDAKLRALGRSWLEIRQSLEGSGQLSLRDGVVENENVLRDVFGRLSMIPGLVDRLMQKLPPEYQQKLSERDTPLRDMEQSFTVQAGTIGIKQLSVSTENIGLTGDVSLGLDGSLGAQTVLVMDSTLSAAAISSVNELQYLTDSRGQIHLAIKFKGTIDHVIMIPDLQDVASRLAVTKATEMLGGMFQRTMGKQDSSGSGFPTKAPKGSTILAGILGSVLQAEQKSSSDTP